MGAIGGRAVWASAQPARIELHVAFPTARLVLFGMLGCATSCGGSESARGDHTGTTENPTDPGEAGSFLGSPDGGTIPLPCELLANDCPTNHKCSAYAADGGEIPDAARCVPLAAPARETGEPCTVEGSVASGFDDCDVGLACWGVDPNTLEGTCVPLCEAGAPPTCADPNRRCRHAGGPLRICLPACNPLADTCGDDAGCYPFNGWPSCLPDASGSSGAAGDPCMFLNGCNPGLYCAPAAAVPGCRASECCAPFCALSSMGEGCPSAPEQTCLPFFEGDTAPQGLEDLGVCAVP